MCIVAFCEDEAFFCAKVLIETIIFEHNVKYIMNHYMLDDHGIFKNSADLWCHVCLEHDRNVYNIRYLINQSHWSWKTFLETVILLASVCLSGAQTANYF